MDSESKVCPQCSRRNPAFSCYCDQCGRELDGRGDLAPSEADPAPLTSGIPRGWITGHATDTGLVRKTNEDTLWLQTLEPFPDRPDRSVGLFIVADGMGGAAAGEVASRMAVEIVSQEFSHYLDVASRVSGEPDWEVLLKNSVTYANHEIYTARRAAGNDMGTTLVGALLTDGRATVVNVGDSRAYQINRREIRQISKDHSLVQGLVDSGQIAAEEIRTHPQRNLILRSLGGQPEVKSDTFRVDLAPNDMLLLCSDGLWEMVPDAEILGIVANASTPDQACDALIKSAREYGGHDNITVVLVQVRSAAETQPLGGQT